MMMSAFEYFERLCSTTVLPQPKPPGTIADPPSATGKRQSNTRWPVRNNSSQGSFDATGRGRFTGHLCIKASCEPSSSTATVSVTVYCPADTILLITPDLFGGTSIL